MVTVGVDPIEFLGLEPGNDPRRWRLPVTPRICSGIGALFGGNGLAAGVATMERVTGQPLVCGTAQFLTFARPPQVLDVEVSVLAEGTFLTQARAILRDGDQEIVAVSGTLGERPGVPGGTWALQPGAPAPEQCAPRELSPSMQGTMIERIDARMAGARDYHELDGVPGDGRSAMWTRVPGLDAGAALLSIVGDFVPMGVSQALGTPVMANSLDNTIRIVDPRGSDGWILADVRIHAVARGLGHGLVHLWAEDGRLLATGTQSTVVRPRRSGHPYERPVASSPSG